MFHIFRIHALMDGWIEWVIECAPWLFLCFFEAHYCLNIRLKKRTSLFTPHSLVIQVPDNQIIFVTFVEGARAREWTNERASERALVPIAGFTVLIQPVASNLLWITYWNPDPIFENLFHIHAETVFWVLCFVVFEHFWTGVHGVIIVRKVEMMIWCV